MITINNNGLYCAQADVYIDPWRSVPKAIITHAHSDHARTGSKSYLAHTKSEQILYNRLGKHINIETLAYNNTIEINGVKISLHPAGHIIGSAQVRLEYKGEVWVISGDYKVFNDGITTPFEPIQCHHFVTESTFGMPIYTFNAPQKEEQIIQDWCMQNAANNCSSILIGYALGKAQRLLHTVRNLGLPILVHNSIYETNTALGFSNTNATSYSTLDKKSISTPSIVIVPPGASQAQWLQKITNSKTAICSGWMQTRAARTRSNVDKGFAISDHADWPSLLQAIKATQASNIYITHGFKNILARYLNENENLNAVTLDTLFEGDDADTTNLNFNL